MFRGKYTDIHSHFYMLADTHRVKNFVRAIRQKVHVGSTVIDLGAGTGILGIECAKAGADIVHMVEQEPKLIPVIEAMVKEHNVEDRCIIHNKRSDDFFKEYDGPKPDLMVCEGIGDHIFESRIIYDFLKAKQQLGGIDTIPGVFKLNLHSHTVRLNREPLESYHTVLDKLNVPKLDSVNIIDNVILDPMFKWGDKIGETKTLLNFGVLKDLKTNKLILEFDRTLDDDEYLVLYFDITLGQKLNISNSPSREAEPHSYYQRLVSCKGIHRKKAKLIIDYEKHIPGIEDQPYPNLEIVNVL